MTWAAEDVTKKAQKCQFQMFCLVRLDIPRTFLLNTPRKDEIFKGSKTSQFPTLNVSHEFQSECF